MMQRSWAWILTLIFCVTPVFSQVGQQPDPDWYRQQWSDREREARVSAKRIDLARDLANAAESESERDHRLFLAHKAFRWGSSDLNGYAWAAQSLNLIQRIDSTQRIWCLEQMAGLYESAYRARSTVLRLGSGHGETLMELAHERLDSAEDQFAAGQIAVTEATVMLRQCQADLQRANAAFAQVISRAESDARKLRALGNKYEKQAQSLDRFAAEFRPKADEINAFRQDVSRQQAVMSQIQGVELRYKSRPNVVTAEPLALAYVVQLDQPERVDGEAVKLLADPLNKRVPLACAAVGKLTGEQAADLAGWYMDLVASASTDDAKLNMATRAALYARCAVDRKAADAQVTLDRAIAAGASLGSQAGYFDNRIRDLQARLKWMNGEPDHTTIASTIPTTTTTTTVTDVTPVPPPSDTTTSTTATSTTTTTTVASDTPVSNPNNPNAKVVMRNGRPMTICTQCGREFFAGWGDDHPTLCPRCSAGGKNIFDFGDE